MYAEWIVWDNYEGVQLACLWTRCTPVGHQELLTVNYVESSQSTVEKSTVKSKSSSINKARRWAIRN